MNRNYWPVRAHIKDKIMILPCFMLSCWITLQLGFLTCSLNLLFSCHLFSLTHGMPSVWLLVNIKGFKGWHTGCCCILYYFIYCGANHWNRHTQLWPILDQMSHSDVAINHIFLCFLCSKGQAEKYTLTRVDKQLSFPKRQKSSLSWLQTFSEPRPDSVPLLPGEMRIGLFGFINVNAMLDFFFKCHIVP